MASIKPPSSPEAVPIEENSSLLERASVQFGKFSRREFSLPLDAVPQLEWEKEAFAAAQRDAQMRSPEADQGNAEAQSGQLFADTFQHTVPTAEEPVGPTTPNTQVHRLDHAAMRRVGLLVPGDDATSLSEEYRILRREALSGVPAISGHHNASHASNSGAHVVLVTSPHSGEGKTFTAINLALSLASEIGPGADQREVVLIDADCMKPSIARLLGLPLAPGLLEVLADPTLTPENCLIRTDCAGLRVITAGLRAGGNGDALTGPRMQHVLALLSQENPNRVIVIDTPPALVASVAVEIAPYVGQCLLIARAGVTGQSALEDCVDLLSGCRSIKLLLNAAFFSPSGRKFGSYYGEAAGSYGENR